LGKQTLHNSNKQALSRKYFRLATRAVNGNLDFCDSSVGTKDLCIDSIQKQTIPFRTVWLISLLENIKITLIHIGSTFFRYINFTQMRSSL